MDKVTEIKSHPRYKFEEPPEREFLEQKPTSLLPADVAICALCVHHVDRNPLWRRLLNKPLLMNSRCELVKRKPTLNPITGEKAYLPTGTALPCNSVDEPYEACWLLNSAGSCKYFARKYKLDHVDTQENPT